MWRNISRHWTGKLPRFKKTIRYVPTGAYSICNPLICAILSYSHWLGWFPIHCWWWFFTTGCQSAGRSSPSRLMTQVGKRPSPVLWSRSADACMRSEGTGQADPCCLDSCCVSWYIEVWKRVIRNVRTRNKDNCWHNTKHVTLPVRCDEENGTNTKEKVYI